MQYQRHDFARGEGSPSQRGVRVSLRNAIFAVLCAVTLIVTALALPTSRATADGPTRHPWGVFPDTPPAYCGDSSVTVLSSTGSVYLVGVGSDIAKAGEREAGADGSREVAAKCMIPGPLLPGYRTFSHGRITLQIPGSPAATLATAEGLASAKDGTLWAVVNQTQGKNQYVAIYRIKPGETEWTQMGGSLGGRTNQYWGYHTTDVKNLGYVIGGSVNPTDNRYYFVSTQSVSSGRSTEFHFWQVPEDSNSQPATTDFPSDSSKGYSGMKLANCTIGGTDECRPTEVGSFTLEGNYTGGDIAFTDNGDAVFVDSRDGETHKVGNTRYKDVTSRTGLIPAAELSQGGSLTLHNPFGASPDEPVTSTGSSWMRNGSYEPGEVSGLGMSHKADGKSFPVISRLAYVTDSMNNLYDFTGYQLDASSLDLKSKVFNFPKGPAYRNAKDPAGMDIQSDVIDRDTIWKDKYSRTSDSRFFDSQYTDIADGARAPTGSLTINKVDKEDTNHKLPGAEFDIWRRTADGCNIKKPADVTPAGPTDEHGQATVSNLAYGAYCVKETKAPDGYKLNDQAQPVDISAANPNVTLTFTDEGLRGTIRVAKTDATSDAALPGAIFDLYRDVDGNGTIDSGDTKYPDDRSATKTTDANGQAEWADIPLGHYVLRETGAPSGYVTPSSPQSDTPVEVTKDNAGSGVTVSVSNERKKGTISWGKYAAGHAPTVPTVPGYPNGVFPTSALTGGFPTEGTLGCSQWTLTHQASPGAPARTITIRDNAVSGACASRGSNDENSAEGLFQVSNLEWGTWELKETSAPAGYVRDDTTYQFVIGANTLSLSRIITNRKAQGPKLPLTGGTAADVYVFASLGLTALAILASILYLRRRKAGDGR